MEWLYAALGGVLCLLVLVAADAVLKLLAVVKELRAELIRATRTIDDIHSVLLVMNDRAKRKESDDSD